MTISTVLQLPAKRNQLLFNAGLVSLVGFAICLGMTFIDQRLVNGVNTWLKPMKFYASFMVFLWTFALILHHIPAERKVKLISKLLVLCMVMEAIPITVQAARAVPSHYNADTLFDLIVFQIMGLFILINTGLAIYVLVLFSRSALGLSEPVKRAVQLGLLIFIGGAVSGGMMVGISNHIVGESVVAAGLPFLGWSRETGDLRAAHFFTLHALQIIPLVALLFKSSILSSKTAVNVWAGVYALFCIWLHQQALSGEPFL